MSTARWSSPRAWWHLAARFATSLSPRPPEVVDEVWAESHLTAGERVLWREQSNQDRRHSVAVARRFAERRPTADRAEIAGALLHDVGKVRCGLGTFGRVIGTLVGPRTPRLRAYRDHEPIGARLVAEAGSDLRLVALVAGYGPAAEDLHTVDHA